MLYIEKFIKQLLWITNEMSPYLLLGFFIAGLLHVLFSKEKIASYLGKRNLKSVVLASLFGIPLPLCSCGVIPTGISFHRRGASKGASVSFLISTPQTGIDSILVTYSLLGLPFAIIRPIIALLTGVLGGAITNKFADNNHETIKINPKKEIEKQKHGKFYRIFNYAFVEFMQDLSKWLIIGVLIAAVIATIIPENFFTIYINNEYLSMLLVLIASIPLYVCATGSVPIVAVLLAQGLSPGAALIFLMAGPATNAATMTVLSKSLGKKAFFAYLSAILIGAFGFGLFINHFLPSDWFVFEHLRHIGQGHGEHELLPNWLKVASSIMLVVLIINGYIQKYLNKNRKINNKNISKIKNMKELVFNVKGMTCKHCKANVEKNLLNFNELEFVEADPDQNTVLVQGDNIDIEKIKKTISDLGYDFKGKI